MRNRAKCKLCQEIIESFHEHDWVNCKCGQISVSLGKALGCGAIDWNNFLRIDDLGKEIVPVIKDKEEEFQPVSMKKKDILMQLEEMIKSYENLPSHAMLHPVTNYDLCSLAILILALFKSEE